MRNKMLFFCVATGLATAVAAAIPALTPVPAGGPGSAWMRRFEQKQAEIRAKGGSKVVFIGDSIVQGWELQYWRDWEKEFGGAPYNAIAFGFSGDRTEHVLWRIAHGELDGYEAKAIELMIGTNNTGHRSFAQEPPIDTIVGVKAVLDAIRAKQPKARVILCGILPRGQTPADPLRRRNAVVNKEIRKFADDVNVFWCDFGDRLLTSDGRLLREVSPDFLHPTEVGYRIWTDAVKPFVNDALMAKEGDLPRVCSTGATRIEPADYSDEMPRAAAPSCSRIMTRGTVVPFGWYEKRLAEKRNLIVTRKHWDLVFLGDSITHNWESAGKAMLEKLGKTYSVLPLGYGGDCTEHVIWRLQNGELEGYTANLFMLMIGTNNGGRPEDVAAGVKRILAILAARHPEAKVLLLPVFPRGEKPTDPMRLRVAKISDLIRPLADGEKVWWCDFREKFLEPDGTMLRSTAGDFLHPGPKGYEQWTEAALPFFEKACGKPKKGCDGEWCAVATSGVGPAPKVATTPSSSRLSWAEMTPTQIIRRIEQNYSRRPFEPHPWLKMATSEFLPFVDRYGQFKHREWPGKTHSDADLAAAKAREAEDLAAHPGPSDWDRFGGWATGPQLEATGRFRVTKRDGKWWLVDPDGHLYFSLGVTRVSPSCAVTPLNGNDMPDRDCFHAELPAKGTSLAKFYETCNELLKPYYLMKGETRWFDYSSANLYRKYGENYYAAFGDIVHRRLRSWGFNSFGNSSDVKIALMDRTPYAERIEAASRALEGSVGIWRQFRDPFDPSFVPGVVAAIEKHGREAHDPWCIGFFVDNELNWGKTDTDLAKWTLASPKDQPARIEFLRRLKAKYGREPAADEVAEADLREFSAALVEEYFKRTRDTLKAYDPGLLYLGCRFIGGTPDRIAVAAAKYVDALSNNIYHKDVANWKLPAGVDKPIVVGEFFFGALDRGLFAGGCGVIDTRDQADRAESFRRYVRSALEHPNFIGVHWHQFSDEPVSGRFDGEMFQMGLTDICDNPYPETIAAARDIGYRMYQIRK